MIFIYYRKTEQLARLSMAAAASSANSNSTNAKPRCFSVQCIQYA